MLFLSCLSVLNLSIANAQTSTEVFEDDTVNSPSFTDSGTLFDVISSEGYNIFEHGFISSGIPPSTDTCLNCGWNGTAIDQKFIDNSGRGLDGNFLHNGDNNGSGFTIATNDSSNIFVFDFYLFTSTNLTLNHTGSVSFTGRRNGLQVYTFTKNTGFSNVQSFTPNNGYTFINFATSEGAGDFTGIPIDELVISSTGNLDYMALDAFRWEGTLTPVELLNFSIE